MQIFKISVWGFQLLGTTPIDLGSVTVVSTAPGEVHLRWHAPGNYFVLITDGSGNMLINSAWPTGVPPEFTMYLQCWVVDPGATFGMAGSNAISGTTPP